MGIVQLAGRSTLRRAPDLRFTPAGEEEEVSLPASRVDLLDEGLLAGVESGVAAVDRPDGVPARDREGAPEARLAVGIERHPRHHRVAHEERDGARRRAGPRWVADRGRERDRLPYPGRVGGRKER